MLILVVENPVNKAASAKITAPHLFLFLMQDYFFFFAEKS